MAHNIGQMFYYGDRPWHELGNRLDHPADLKEALKAGGLDWEVKKVPIVPKGEPRSDISHRVALVRKDRRPGQPGRVVGVVHPDFHPLQNRQGAQVFDALIGQGRPIYHTGGYLKNGEVVWLLAKLPNEIKVRDKDVLQPYLLFSNSHDGSLAIDIRLTMIRVVCENTLSMALGKNAAGNAFRRAHDGRYDLLREEAKQFFNFSIAQCKAAQELFVRLSHVKCEQAAFETFLKRLLPDPTKPATASSNMTVQRAWETRMESVRVARDEVQEVHTRGISSRNIPPGEDSWWGALNSVTAWVDHVQKTENDRYAHILLGSGDKMKSLALKLLTAKVLK